MDATISGVGAKTSLIESRQIDRLDDQAAQVTPTTANETRELVALMPDTRAAASTAYSSKAPVHPGELAMDVLKRLDPFLQQAHSYGRIAAMDDLVRSMPTPMARAGAAFASLDPTAIHPGPARKSLAPDVPNIEGGIEGRFPERALDGTIDSFHDSVIDDLFGSEEGFRQWSNDMIGEAFKGRMFQVQLGLVARGLRGATDALATLTTRQA